MQFKHPELLWALFLLVIPIIVHLFQLRRFQRTPFTNVKLLQRVVSKSRRSRTLKKWLLLATRLLGLAALVIAFTQPFLANKTALRPKERVIYIDDSFSMQARTGDGATLLEQAVQEFIGSIPESETFSLFTNGKNFKDVTLSNIRNDLLSLGHTPTQLSLEEIERKAATLFEPSNDALQELIVVSDFQERMAVSTTDSTSGFRRHLVQLRPEESVNISIDSAYIGQGGGETVELIARLRADSGTESIPVSLFDGEQLIAKTAAVFDADGNSQCSFSLEGQGVIRGRLEISDAGLAYDNRLFFNIDAREKIKVLAIGDTDGGFLGRIFTEEAFDFTSVPLSQLNYRDISEQNLIVLNELESIPSPLVGSLNSLTDEGGSLTVIPARGMDLDSYNALTIAYDATQYQPENPFESDITGIVFSHPLYQGVFERTVSNFQYPRVSAYYPLRSRAPHALTLADGSPFLLGRDNTYFFAASFAADNTNFTNSPLIVPTFYAMGLRSLKLPGLYHVLGENAEVDIPIELPKDRILTVSKADYSFIPQQRSLSNKIRLEFDQGLVEDGIYHVDNDQEIVRNISFNFPRAESELRYANLESTPATSKNESLSTLLTRLEKDNAVTDLWKWFVILALLFLLLEILIQKYLR